MKESPSTMHQKDKVLPENETVTVSLVCGYNTSCSCFCKSLRAKTIRASREAVITYRRFHIKFEYNINLDDFPAAVCCQLTPNWSSAKTSGRFKQSSEALLALADLHQLSSFMTHSPFTAAWQSADRSCPITFR